MSSMHAHRPIQIIVALLMVLGMLIGTPAAQAAPGASAGSSGSLSLDCAKYNITSSSSYDAAGDATTFSYAVTATTAAPHAVSHWVLSLGTCIGSGDVVAASHAYTFGTDPTTGVRGIKFDVAIEKGQTINFWFTLDGYWPESTNDAAIKAGSDYCLRSVIGPSCETPVYYSISGAKWNDADGDASWDGAEFGLAGWTIELRNSAGAVIATTATSANGAYSFTGLVPGTYTVSEVQQSGWTQTFPAGNSHAVALGTANVTGRDFGNQRLGTLIVEKRVVGFTGAGSFEICVSGPSHTTADCQTLTGPGTLTWANLIPGSYNVSETDPGAFWTVEVSPSSVPVTSGITATAIITNTYDEPELGSIRVRKVTVPSGASTEFPFTFESAPFALQDGESELFAELAAGAYDIAEIVPEGWDLTDVSCVEVALALTSDTPSFIYSATGVAVTLGEGDHVTCTFTNTEEIEETYAIAGAKWNDADADGLWGATEIGLAGWTIELRNANGGLIDSTVTGADGSYSFSGLLAGEYRLNEVLQATWTQTGPLDGTDVIVTHVVSLPGDAVSNVATGYDFGNYRPLDVPTYDLSGSKWNDADGDGAWDATEVGLAGWEIVLTHGDTVLKTTTAADGSYSFTNLEPGAYTVAETQQSGWTQTFPTGGTHSVTIVDADVADIDFGNRIPDVPVYNLSGSKWNDANGDGAWDADEPGLAGWTIQLKNAQGAVIGTTTTGADGSYSFAGLVAGSYTVSEGQKDGWNQTFPGGNGTHGITIGNADVSDVDFGNRYTFVPPSYGLSGFKWADGNENALWDTGEPALSGWTIELRDAAGKVLATAVTGSNGAYSFTDLEPGAYIVAEVQQSGWKQTFPTGAGTHEVELVEESVTGVNFGNYRPLEQLPTPVPCTRADVAVVVYGGWNDIAVKAWVGGTEQPAQHTALDSFGQQQAMWTLYPPANTSWTVTVEPQTPAGKDPARWQYKLLRIESPSSGSSSDNPGSASVSIRRCNQYVFYYQLMDMGSTPDVAPTPPSDPGLPVTGGTPGPLLAGGLSIFAALSGLGWSLRRRHQ